MDNKWLNIRQVQVIINEARQWKYSSAIDYCGRKGLMDFEVLGKEKGTRYTRAPMWGKKMIKINY